MSNADRLPSYQWFCGLLGEDFLQDTYRVVYRADGYEDVIKINVNQLNSPSYIDRAKAGSVTAQIAELYWGMYRDDFWEWYWDGC